VNISEQRQICSQSNAELVLKPVVGVAWRGEEAIKQKGRLGGRAVGCTFIGKPSGHWEGRKVFRYRKEGRTWRFEEPDTYRRRGWQ
jgi:hypothetical protein